MTPQTDDAMRNLILLRREYIEWRANVHPRLANTTVPANLDRIITRLTESIRSERGKEFA